MTGDEALAIVEIDVGLIISKKVKAAEVEVEDMVEIDLTVEVDLTVETDLTVEVGLIVGQDLTPGIDTAEEEEEEEEVVDAGEATLDLVHTREVDRGTRAVGAVEEATPAATQNRVAGAGIGTEVGRRKERRIRKEKKIKSEETDHTLGVEVVQEVKKGAKVDQNLQWRIDKKNSKKMMLLTKIPRIIRAIRRLRV